MFDKMQKNYLSSLGVEVNLDTPTEEEIQKIKVAVQETLDKKGFDQNYNLTPEGVMCQTILEVLEQTVLPTLCHFKDTPILLF